MSQKRERSAQVLLKKNCLKMLHIFWVWERKTDNHDALITELHG